MQFRNEACKLIISALNFLYSPGGNSYSRSFSATPDFLGLCREHRNTKMIRLGGGTPKATAALAQNKFSVAPWDTREPCQGFQEVLAMHLVPKIDFASELIENSLVAHVLEVKVPHLY